MPSLSSAVTSASCESRLVGTGHGSRALYASPDSCRDESPLKGPNSFRLIQFRKNASASPLESHTFKTKDLKPFRITYFQKKGGGWVPLSNIQHLTSNLRSSLSPLDSALTSKRAPKSFTSNTYEKHTQGEGGLPRVRARITSHQSPVTSHESPITNHEPQPPLPPLPPLRHPNQHGARCDGPNPGAGGRHLFSGEDAGDRAQAGHRAENSQLGRRAARRSRANTCWVAHRGPERPPRSARSIGKAACRRQPNPCDCVSLSCAGGTRRARASRRLPAGFAALQIHAGASLDSGVGKVLSALRNAVAP